MSYHSTLYGAVKDLVDNDPKIPIGCFSGPNRQADWLGRKLYLFYNPETGVRIAPLTLFEIFIREIFNLLGWKFFGLLETYKDKIIKGFTCDNEPSTLSQNEKVNKIYRDILKMFGKEQNKSADHSNTRQSVVSEPPPKLDPANRDIDEKFIKWLKHPVPEHLPPLLSLYPHSSQPIRAEILTLFTTILCNRQSRGFLKDIVSNLDKECDIAVITQMLGEIENEHDKPTSMLWEFECRSGYINPSFEYRNEKHNARTARLNTEFHSLNEAQMRNSIDCNHFWELLSMVPEVAVRALRFEWFTILNSCYQTEGNARNNAKLCELIRRLETSTDDDSKAKLKAIEQISKKIYTPLTIGTKLDASKTPPLTTANIASASDQETPVSSPAEITPETPTSTAPATIADPAPATPADPAPVTVQKLETTPPTAPQKTKKKAKPAETSPKSIGENAPPPRKKPNTAKNKENNNVQQKMQESTNGTRSGTYWIDKKTFPKSPLVNRKIDERFIRWLEKSIPSPDHVQTLITLYPHSDKATQAKMLNALNTIYQSNELLNKVVQNLGEERDIAVLVQLLGKLEKKDHPATSKLWECENRLISRELISFGRKLISSENMTDKIQARIKRLDFAFYYMNKEQMKNSMACSSFWDLIFIYDKGYALSLQWFKELSSYYSKNKNNKINEIQLKALIERLEKSEDEDSKAKLKAIGSILKKLYKPSY